MTMGGILQKRVLVAVLFINSIIIDSVFSQQMPDNDNNLAGKSNNCFPVPITAFLLLKNDNSELIRDRPHAQSPPVKKGAGDYPVLRSDLEHMPSLCLWVKKISTGVKF